MKRILLMAVLALVCRGAVADDEVTQTVTVNGQQVEKAVKKITFDGDQVVLTYADDSQQSADLEQVSIVFSYATAIESVRVAATPDVADEPFYTLDGRRLQDRPATKGVYITKGKKVIVK